MPNKLAIIADYSTELLIHFGSTISVIPNRFFIATIFDFKLLLPFFATGLNRMCRNPTTRARNRICELWTKQLSTRRKEKKNEFANPENWILRRRWGKTPNQKVSTQYTFAIIYFSRSLAFLLLFFLQNYRCEDFAESAPLLRKPIYDDFGRNKKAKKNKRETISVYEATLSNSRRQQWCAIVLNFDTINLLRMFSSQPIEMVMRHTSVYSRSISNSWIFIRVCVSGAPKYVVCHKHKNNNNNKFRFGQNNFTAELSPIV